MLFLGNRADLPAHKKQVTVDKVKAIVGAANVKIAEVSAKKNVNVKESFDSFTKLLIAAALHKA